MKPIPQIEAPAAKARLLAQRVVIAESRCWEYGGNRRENGYGRMWLNGRLWLTHRVAAHIWLGLDIADTKTYACHHCDNPPCFNPDHLFLGTAADNIADCCAKGRFVYRSGDRQSKYPRFRACDVCGESYEPPTNRRSRSRVCSADCLAGLRAINALGRGHKLTADGVRAIRAGLDAGRPRRELADEFGVSDQTIKNIARRKAWGHVV